MLLNYYWVTGLPPLLPPILNPPESKDLYTWVESNVPCPRTQHCDSQPGLGPRQHDHGKHSVSRVNREFKQIATAGADTAAGSKFPPKCDTAHVRWLHQAVARFAVVATTLALFRFSGPFQRTSGHFKNSIAYYIP